MSPSGLSFRAGQMCETMMRQQLLLDLSCHLSKTWEKDDCFLSNLYQGEPICAKFLLHHIMQLVQLWSSTIYLNFI